MAHPVLSEDTMCPSFPASQGSARLIDDERCASMIQHRAVLQRHGRAVTLGIALRHVRTAQTEHRLLATIEEILVQHVGVAAFAVVDTVSAAPRILAVRGVVSGDTDLPPIARVPLGSGEWTLGVLFIYRLIERKDGLDAFDHELLAALGPQIAVALHAARIDSERPTIPPPCMARTEGA
jgi:hypothetical protein